MTIQEIQALKETLVRRLNKSFQNQMSNYSFDFEEGVGAFLDFIKLPINSEESALDLTVLPNLYQYYVGATSYEEQLTIVKEIATSLDPVLKKILYYIDNTKYNQLASQRKGLKEYILALPLLIKDYPATINSSPNNKPEVILYNIAHIQTTDRGMPYDLHKAYFTRNHVHAAKEWEETELTANIKACVVTYLYAFFEYYQQLKPIISPQAPSYDFAPYLQRTLTEFQKNLLSDYTDLSAKETDLYDENLTPMAKEYYEADYEEDENDDFDEEDFELAEETNRITKPTKVNEIRTQVSKMLVRGDAGMGKTTTLEHLFLADLQNALQNLAIIPFFFELKDYNGKDLLAQIAKQNKVDETALRKALQEGKVCLFLDGFDEILSDEKRNNLEIIIKDEILTTPSQVLISSRVREYEHDIFKMRVFDLQALSKEQIREFASKNIAEDKKAIFLQALFEKENSILLSICRNIFILKVYKNEIIEAENGEISSKNIGKLLQNLVNRRVDRQIKENKPNANTVKKDLGKYKKMINFLAYMLIDKELNFEYDLAMELLENKYEDLRLADDCLNFYKSIGLIKGETEILKFTHKLYWEYFAAEFIWAKIQLQFDDIQRYIAVPKWKKVLNLVHGLAGETSTKIVETVAVTDALTMAESIGSSIEQKPEEVAFVTIEAEIQARNFENAEVSAQGFLALMELGQQEKILEIFKNIKPDKLHKKIIKEFTNKAQIDKVLNFISMCLVLPSYQNPIKYWSINNFNTTITNEIQRKIFFNLIKRFIKNTNGNKYSLRATTAWIEKYQIDDKSIIETLIEKLIQNGHKDSLLRAEVCIEKYQITTQYLIIYLIEKLVQKGYKNYLEIIEAWIEKYQAQDKSLNENLLKKLIQNGDVDCLQVVEVCVEKYQLQDKFAIKDLIEKLLQNRNKSSLQLAETWIEKYQLQYKFFIEDFIEKLIEKGSNSSLKLVDFWIKKYQLQDIFVIEIIKKLVIRDTSASLKLATFLIKNFQLESKFTDINLFKTQIITKNIINIQVDDIVECKISNIIKTHIFVKIEEEKRSASILIKKVANEYIPDITQFEYNGEKLHKGQTLTAKVISIDEKHGIQLSLKQVK